MTDEKEEGPKPLSLVHECTIGNFVHLKSEIGTQKEYVAEIIKQGNIPGVSFVRNHGKKIKFIRI